MKFNFKKGFFSVILITIFCLSTQSLAAQPGFDDDVDDETDPPAAMIDGLLALGISAGVVYGLKKLKKQT
ncbi:MAG: hypothetical protein ACK4UK_05490 [Flavobacterium sp.]